MDICIHNIHLYAILRNYTEKIQSCHVFICFGHLAPRLLLKKNANASYITSEGRNALHFASTPEIIEMLLEKHVNVNQIDENGKSPLLDKLMQAREEWLRSQVVKLLLDAGADPNVKSKGLSNTPLHYAASYGLVEIVKMLLAKKADVNARNSEGASGKKVMTEGCVCWQEQHGTTNTHGSIS